MDNQPRVNIERIERMDVVLIEKIFELEKICFGEEIPYTFGSTYREYYLGSSLDSFKESVRKRGDILLVAKNEADRVIGVLLMERYTKEQFVEFFEKTNDGKLKYQEPFWYIDSMFIAPKYRGTTVFFKLIKEFGEILRTHSQIYRNTDLIRFHASTSNSADNRKCDAHSMASSVIDHIGIGPLWVVENYFYSNLQFDYYEIPVARFAQHSQWEEMYRIENDLAKASNWVEKYTSLFKVNPKARNTVNMIEKYVQAAKGHMHVGGFVLTDALDSLYDKRLSAAENFEQTACELHPYRLEIIPIEKATEEALESLAKYGSGENATLKALSFLNMGIIATRKMNTAVAIHWYKKALLAAEETQSKTLKARCLVVLGNMQLVDNNFPNALECAGEAITLINKDIDIRKKTATKQRHSMEEAEITVTLGLAHLLLARTQLAIFDIKKAECDLTKALEYLKNYHGVFWDRALQPIVHCYLNIGKADEAKVIIKDNYDTIFYLTMNVADQIGQWPAAVNEWLLRHRTQATEMNARCHIIKQEFDEACNIVRCLFKVKPNSDDVDLETIMHLYELDKVVFVEVCRHLCRALKHRYGVSEHHQLISSVRNFEELLTLSDTLKSEICEGLEEILTEANLVNGFTCGDLHVIAENNNKFFIEYNGYKRKSINDQYFHILYCMHISGPDGVTKDDIVKYLDMKKAGIAESSIGTCISRLRNDYNLKRVIQTIGKARHSRYRLIG